MDMPQITRTTQDVIVNALYLLGELGVGETPDGFMLTTGLDLINELLDKFSSDSIYIPFLTTINFNFIVGQPTYSISDIAGPTDIVSDRIVDLSFANFTVPGTGIGVSPPPIQFAYTADTVSNTLTFADTSAFPTGQEVVLTTTGTIPVPLFAGTVYYAINVSPTQIQLALTLNNALMSVPIVLLTDGLPVNIIATNENNFPPSLTNIVYPLYIISKAEFYNTTRLLQLNARPNYIFLNKQPTESLITVYPAPDQPYPCTIQVKGMINSLDINDNLTELPPYYYGFLKYALAAKFLAYYPSGNWPEGNQKELDDYYSNLKNANETDLTIRPTMILNSNGMQPAYWQNILALP